MVGLPHPDRVHDFDPHLVRVREVCLSLPGASEREALVADDRTHEPTAD